MGRSLENILELEFNLLYYLGALSQVEIESMDVKEIDWFYGRLIEKKREEHENVAKGRKKDHAD